MFNQLGTLGGGNHFIEIGETGKPLDNLWDTYVTIHIGSRGLGQAVCSYHQGIITAGTKKDWNSYNAELRLESKQLRKAS